MSNAHKIFFLLQFSNFELEPIRLNHETFNSYRFPAPCRNSKRPIGENVSNIVNPRHKLCNQKFILTISVLSRRCLEDIFPSGYARSDPIISQSCASSHVHTVSLRGAYIKFFEVSANNDNVSFLTKFYGPQNFHPDTTYEDIRDTPNRFSTAPWVENQSLYWVSNDPVKRIQNFVFSLLGSKVLTDSTLY